MPDGSIDLRFVRNIGWQYSVVAWRGLICMPFTPTHVEARTKAGTYLGMHGKPHDGFPAGMVERDVGYDDDKVYTMLDGRRCDIIVSLPCTAAQEDVFYDYLRRSIGEPYDWSAPWAFLLGGHHHRRFNSTCAAKIHMGLRTCNMFRWPTAKPAHEYNPADLLDVVSHLVEVPH